MGGFSNPILLGTSPSGKNYGHIIVDIDSTFITGFNYKIKAITNDGKFCYSDPFTIIAPDSSIVFSMQNNFCANSSPISLNGGFPLGGYYSGNAVHNNILYIDSLNAGSYPVYYNYPDGYGCINSREILVNIIPLPAVVINNLQDSICDNDAPIILSGNQIAGVFYGQGVVNNTFNPDLVSSDTAMIYYSYTDTNNCSNIDSGIININDSPNLNLGNDTSLCAGLSISLASVYQGYIWSTGDQTPIIVVDSTGVGNGTKLIWCYVYNSSYCSDIDTILITFDDCSFVNEFDNSMIQVYPNPSYQYVYIQFSDFKLGNYKIKLSALDGSIIFEDNLMLTSTNKLHKIDLKNLAKGVYFISIANDESYLLRKIIKQ